MSNKVENFFRYLRNHELKLFLNINYTNRQTARRGVGKNAYPGH
jgi:hypothetical protein